MFRYRSALIVCFAYMYSFMLGVYLIGLCTSYWDVCFGRLIKVFDLLHVYIVYGAGVQHQYLRTRHRAGRMPNAGEEGKILLKVFGARAQQIWIWVYSAFVFPSNHARKALFGKGQARSFL